RVPPLVAVPGRSASPGPSPRVRTRRLPAAKALLRRATRRPARHADRRPQPAQLALPRAAARENAARSAARLGARRMAAASHDRGVAAQLRRRCGVRGGVRLPSREGVADDLRLRRSRPRGGARAYPARRPGLSLVCPRRQRGSHRAHARRLAKSTRRPEGRDAPPRPALPGGRRNGGRRVERAAPSLRAGERARGSSRPQPVSNEMKQLFTRTPVPEYVEYSRVHVGAGDRHHRPFPAQPGRALMWELERAALERIVAQTAPASILDFACGTGRISSFLEERFPQMPIWGIDIAESMLELARQGARRTEYLQMSSSEAIAHFGEKRFDLVVAFR